MSRTVKAPHIRRAEILDVALTLFRRLGYAATTVDGIVREAGVAKGTFYYYFPTKEAVLAALSARMVQAMADSLQRIADDQSHMPLKKLQLMFGEMQRLAAANSSIVDNLHHAGNRELHERNNIETIRTLGPIIAGVVEQGKAEGIFDVEDAVSTVQFMLAGSLFLFGEGMFDWSDDERAARLQAMRQLVVRALGMPPQLVEQLKAQSGAPGGNS